MLPAYRRPVKAERGGANLGVLFNHGIPVPDGFVILTQCYDQFLRGSGLDTRIASLLQPLNGGDIVALTNVSEHVTGWIMQEKIPDEIAGTIYAHFDQLNAPLVAVRSSANAEDRALAYRFQNDLMTADISVAVVVQEMIASEVAGVAFSVHPVTQDPDQMIIEAGFGLGEAVVSGAITPDTYILRKSDRHILETYPSQQLKGVFLNQSGGSTWKEIPDSESDAPKLSPPQIRELADLIIHIEAFFTYPCDIEWARKDGKWYILQCRPITTLNQ
ncbi:MAG: PEP/pyruvate-binding domain-containing protein [bacterium]